MKLKTLEKYESKMEHENYFQGNLAVKITFLALILGVSQFFKW